MKTPNSPIKTYVQVFCMAVITKRAARNDFTSCARNDDSFSLNILSAPKLSSICIVGKDGKILTLSDKRFEIFRRFEFVTVFHCLSMGKSPTVDWETIRGS